MTDTVEAIVAEMRADIVTLLPEPAPEVIRAWADRLQSAHEAMESRLREAERAIAEAPRVEITACNQIAGASDFDFGDMTSAALKFKPGQFVAIVPIDRAMEGAE